MIGHSERHRIHRIGWLRAAVLGANDGIISIASLILGIAAAGASHNAVVISGVAGLLAGAMSMASGEYVSVSSQLDTETADLDKERLELIQNPELEQEELIQIYIKRGLSIQLARQVAIELMSQDGLKAHARDELGITEVSSTSPLFAALSSALAFSVGGFAPLMIGSLVSMDKLVLIVSLAVAVLLAFLGGISAYLGGARIPIAIARVVFWGLLSMGVTSAIGGLVGGAG
ncbi:VIT family protein [Polynucleobacter sp. AP-Reno-20A-A9]|uniref:VIT1/CCC1 transporter family protein n=1 Tax=Polynucleobacter sp. AP-Reno-20A-A9 TaxID=2576925 RepID=UPI001C20E3DE|nr:VIT family protein [Polynucleobacter sp. AP-Reno-20A-A9]